MKRLSLLTLSVVMLAGSLTCCHSASAQATADRDVETPTETSTNPTDKEWYYGPTENPEKPKEAKTLGRLRAEQRAQQRQNRLETLRWYGISTARPLSSGMPFTSAYNPSWTRPTGPRYVWQTSYRPRVLVTPYHSSYYR